jgi:hypothetical protein
MKVRKIQTSMEKKTIPGIVSVWVLTCVSYDFQGKYSLESFYENKNTNLMVGYTLVLKV